MHFEMFSFRFAIVIFPAVLSKQHIIFVYGHKIIVAGCNLFNCFVVKKWERHFKSLRSDFLSNTM